MKTRTLALGIAALLSLAACGGSDNNDDTAVSGPAPSPAPGPAPAPGITGTDIDMNQAFSQTLDCYYGEKPYYDTAITGPWTVAFDGSQLSLNSTIGNQSFGGEFPSTATRDNEPDSATLSTFIGGSGAGGNIFFTKTTDGTVTRAGHNQFGGTNPRRDSVECGADRDNQWLALPTSTPFSLQSNVFNWTDSQIQLNCARRPAGAGSFDPVFTAVLVTITDGALTVNDSSSDLFGLQTVDEAGRTESVLVDSPRIGGSIWQSESNTDGSAITVSVRPTDRMFLRVQETRADDSVTSCVPTPLDPAF
ncbi:MAG: hypothetical protein AB8C46_16870 [Burkholderiaceae bacterium]